jgi:hypothetical protein
MIHRRLQNRPGHIALPNSQQSRPGILSAQIDRAVHRSLPPKTTFCPARGSLNGVHGISRAMTILRQGRCRAKIQAEKPLSTGARAYTADASFTPPLSGGRVDDENGEVRARVEPLQWRMQRPEEGESDLRTV